MRLLARLVAVTGLVVAGGLALPGGAAQAAACSGTSGVTVVIDYGSSTTTSCALGDPSSAMAALKAVATVVSPQRYPGTVVCRINGTPASDPCIQMPPASAYWAFYHAPRGGSWTYSQSGVTSYNPAPGTAVGFAFGAGATPGTPPPAAAPKPAPKPSPSATSSSKPPASQPKPSSTSPSATQSTPQGTVRVLPNGATTTVPRASTGSATTSKGATTSATTPSATTSTTSVAVDENGDSTGGSGETIAAASDAADGPGSATTLLAGLGLVGLVGAGAAYLAVRRRAHP